jgi:hypothetical protein
MAPCAMPPDASDALVWLAALETLLTAGAPSAGFPAACVMITFLFAMVMVPVRGEIFGFAGMRKSTSPLPVPDCPLVMLIQPGLSVVAVHWQPVWVET